MKVKEQAKKTADTATRVVKNGEQFVQATALAVLCVKVINDIRTEQLDKVWVYVLSAAVAVTALRAFVEYIKFLDKK